MTEIECKGIAIIKLSALGDLIHTIPAFNILRSQFPGSKISWIVNPSGAKLLENFLGIDEIIVINLKVKGVFNKIKEIKRVRQLFKNRFDLLLDFQGLLKSAMLAFLLNTQSFGFNKKNLREPLARIFYKQSVIPFDEKNHVIFKNIHLVKQVLSFLGMPVDESIESPVYPLIPVSKSDKLKSFYSEHQVKENQYFILNVGGGWETKVLQPEQYIKLVNGIKNIGRFIILWGNEKEKKLAEHVASNTGAIISEFLNFTELIFFIRSARFIVTSDTLALHIADLVETPSVGIFGPSSPFRNGSLLPESISVYEKIPCNFCYKKKCGTMYCVTNININYIIESINEKFC
jgi:heptosyltransferase-1